MRLLARLGFVGSGILGIYLSLIPTCYFLVKISASNIEVDDLLILYVGISMVGFPTFTMMLFSHLALGVEKEKQQISKGAEQ